MEMELKHGKMEENILENLSMTNHTEKELSYMLMAQSMLVSGVMANDMEKGP